MALDRTGVNLDSALRMIAAYLSLPADDLARYAAEDDLGGFNFDPAKRTWPQGSLWADEGQTLYALVRAIRPANVLELGVHVGCSTSHLRRAVQKNGYGTVTSVDKWGGAGSLIPAYLSTVGVIHYRDALDFIPELPDNSIGFVFEDLCHEAREVQTVLELVRPKLAPHALIVHHDSEHGVEGEEVKRGIQAFGVTSYLSLLCGETDCGLAVYWL